MEYLYASEAPLFVLRKITEKEILWLTKKPAISLFLPENKLLLE